jgi:integral membrane sensor domain MASE1
MWAKRCLRLALSSANLVRLQPRPSAQRLGIAAAAVFGAAISGVGGTLGFKLFHGSTAPSLTTWQHWFASDALGIVTVAPLLIGVAAAARDPPPPSEFLEGAVALAAIT